MTLGLADEFIVSEAAISDDQLYRNYLCRIWDTALPIVAFCMLNPSTAGAKVNDPTVKAVVRWAKTHQFGGVIILNVFDFRSPFPTQLETVPTPCSVGNESWLWHPPYKERIGLVICAWGKPPAGVWRKHRRLFEHAYDRMMRLAYDCSKGNVRCLGMTKQGFPKHPLYLSKYTSTQPYTCEVFMAIPDKV